MMRAVVALLGATLGSAVWIAVGIVATLIVQTGTAAEIAGMALLSLVALVAVVVMPVLARQARRARRQTAAAVREYCLACRREMASESGHVCGRCAEVQ